MRESITGWGILLYSLMLESHNDTAVAIAEHVAGSVENFAAMMNEKAAQIGCSDSFFVTPNGLDATAAYTAQDGERTGAGARDYSPGSGADHVLPACFALPRGSVSCHHKNSFL